MRLKLIIGLLPFLIFVGVNCQDSGEHLSLEPGTYSGYVVKLDNDTIFGEINIPRKYHRIFFKIELIDKEGNEFYFTPFDLKCFTVADRFFLGNTRVYVDEEPLYRYVFLEQLTDGYLKLYRFQNKQLGIANTNGGKPIGRFEVLNNYVCSYGRLKPNSINSISSLSLYTNDNDEFSKVILAEKLKQKELISIIKSYNSWLNESDDFSHKKKIDSLNAATKHSLIAAQNRSLIQIHPDDRNLEEYMFRLIYYAYNSVGFMDYQITDKRDKHSHRIEVGLKISTISSFHKIGTWKYFYPSKKDSVSNLKRQETYDVNGLLHGFVYEYDKDGKLKRKIRYEHGEKINS
jgi:hypothetical protein